MAQNQIPLDPIQAQLIKTAQTGTASTTSGPAYTQNVFGTRSPAGTGLVEGLRAFSQALGSAADVAKQRKFAEDMVTAGLFAAKNEVAPGLTSQKALLHNYNLLDENYTNRILNQVEVYDNNTATNVANSFGLTTGQKGTTFKTFIDEVKKEATKNVTHNGEALGKLLVKLDGYQHKWEVDIAQFEKAQRMQTTMENLYNDIKNHSAEHTAFPVEFIKLLTAKLKLTELQHEKINVGTADKPKWIRAALSIDHNKAVFSLLKDQVVDSYLEHPELYESLLERWDDYFKPFAIKENALITGGKKDAIGDDQTFQSLFDAMQSDIVAKQKIKTESIKNRNATWFNNFLFGKYTDKKDLTRKDADDFRLQFGPVEGATRLNQAKVYLAAYKYGTGSAPWDRALKSVISGATKTEETLQGLAIQEFLNNDAISKLRGLVGEFNSDFTENIAILKETNVFTDGRIQDLIRNTWLQNTLAPLMKEERFTFQELTQEDWVEKYLLVSNKVQWPNEIKFLITNLQKEVSKHAGKIRDDASKRVYTQPGLKPGDKIIRTFSTDEAAAWSTKRADDILKAIGKLAEWGIVEETRHGKKIKVLRKKEVTDKKGSK